MPNPSARRWLAAALLVLGLAATALLRPAVAAAEVVPTTPAAQQVEVLRTGGIINVPRTFTVRAGFPGDEAARLMRLVTTPEFLALKPQYGPRNPCCDFFIYKLTVTYEGGTTKTVSTSDATVDAPEILFLVIRLTEVLSTAAR